MERKATSPANILIWAGPVLAIAYWPFEGFVHAVIFDRGSFLEQLFTPDINELWMRMFISMLILGICMYAHRMMRCQQEVIDEADRLNRLLRFLSEVNQHVQRRHTARKMFDEVCTAAVEFGGVSFAWVGLVDNGNSSRIKPVAMAACKDECRQAVQQACPEGIVACGMAMQAMATGKPAFCNELTNSDCKAAWRDSLRQYGCHSAAAFPIRVQGRISSALTVYAGNSGFFHDQEIAILAEAADDIAFALTNIEQKKQRTKMESLLKHIVEGTSAVSGKVFFHTLSRHIAGALNVPVVFICEHTDEKVRSLAIFKDGDFEKNFDWYVTGSPCEQVVEGKINIVESGVQEKYPDDQWLRDAGAESYIGIPFTCQSGRIIGHLGIVDTGPMNQAGVWVPVLNVFAERAGVELQRMQVEETLRHRIEELELFQKATVQREFRIKALREEILALKAGECGR